MTFLEVRYSAILSSCQRGKDPIVILPFHIRNRNKRLELILGCLIRALYLSALDNWNQPRNAGLLSLVRNWLYRDHDTKLLVTSIDQVDYINRNTPTIKENRNILQPLIQIFRTRWNKCTYVFLIYTATIISRWANNIFAHTLFHYIYASTAFPWRKRRWNLL